MTGVDASTTGEPVTIEHGPDGWELRYLGTRLDRQRTKTAAVELVCTMLGATFPRIASLEAELADLRDRVRDQDWTGQLRALTEAEAADRKAEVDALRALVTEMAERVFCGNVPLPTRLDPGTWQQRASQVAHGLPTIYERHEAFAHPGGFAGWWAEHRPRYRDSEA